ncbi:MAG: methylamine utilization protein [Kangiellaceae bacterium]|nr:methylamine utilization protein [Kangiellaceae bacterium]
MNQRYLFIWGVIFWGGACQSLAGDIRLSIRDQNNNPLINTVIKLIPENHEVKLLPDSQIIDQINKEYVPQVIVVIKGGAVSFPNKDNIKHHVYSFSEAKQFELPLYEGTPATPVAFDQEGVVVLGCNIHDWMRGYIYVSDSPYTVITDEQGKAELVGLPDDTYQVEIWHPQLKKDIDAVSYSIIGEQLINVEHLVEIKPTVKIRRPQGRRSRRYN